MPKGKGYKEKKVVYEGPKKNVHKRPSDAFSRRKEKPETAEEFLKRDEAMRAGFQKRKKERKGR